MQLSARGCGGVVGCGVVQCGAGLATTGSILVILAYRAGLHSIRPIAPHLRPERCRINIGLALQPGRAGDCESQDMSDPSSINAFYQLPADVRCLLCSRWSGLAWCRAPLSHCLSHQTLSWPGPPMITTELSTLPLSALSLIACLSKN